MTTTVLEAQLQRSVDTVDEHRRKAALARVEQAAPLARSDAELSVQDIIAQVRKVKEVMLAVMKPDEHYGVIPGTGTKPTLLKPGAEKLCLLFRLAPEYHIEERRSDGGHLEVLSRCDLVHVPTGQRRGSGLGMCSTRESKYAYRKAERKCPKCGAEAIRKSKEEYGGGWYCNNRAGGCGAKFNKGDKSIESQDAGRVANPDLADQYNTVLKMANKRSLVAAVLNVTAASDIFTQDLEDLPTPESPRPGSGNPTSVAAEVYGEELPPEDATEPNPFAGLKADLQSHETRIATALNPTNPDQALTDEQERLLAIEIRHDMGSKANPRGRIAAMVQTAKERRTITPQEYKELSKDWARVDRQLAKLEARVKPVDVTESFRDDDEREPGSDG